MNRVLWKLLKAVGGTITITNRELEIIDKDMGIRITHTESTDTFTLTLHKIAQPIARAKAAGIVMPGDANFGVLN